MQTNVPVFAYVDGNDDLMVQVHPSYPAERARAATQSEIELSALRGEEGWIMTMVDSAIMARLERDVQDEES